METPSRRCFLRAAAAAPLGPLALGNGASAAGQETRFHFEPGRDLIPAPTGPADWSAFRAALTEWRKLARSDLGYDDTLFRRPEFAWAARAYCCAFVMLCDVGFYDPGAGRYTPEPFLEAGEREFGGYDALVLWHAYPRIGLDDRNQFDFYRDMPGGLSGLRRLIDTIHGRGTRVFLDYNPWDTGTRREGLSDLDALVDLVRTLDADGIFLDTLSEGAPELRQKLDAARPGVVLEGEVALPLEHVHDHHASWAQGFADGVVPGIMRNKWFERRHMQHQIRRWDHDHTAELQMAWTNGSGMLVWENVFGSWVGWSPRDRSVLRSMLPIQRRFHSVFSSEGWTPLVPTRVPGVFASLWEAEGLRLWTLVNRAEREVQGRLLDVAHHPEERCFDLIAGRELATETSNGRMILEAVIPPRGIGAFVALPTNRVDAEFLRYLDSQREAWKRFDPQARAQRRETDLLPVTATEPRPEVPEGMVAIEVAADVELSIEMRDRECGFYESEPPDGRSAVGSYGFRTVKFRRTLTQRRYAIDTTPVTNAQYAAFLHASGDRPRHPEKFLKHWTNGEVPANLADHPVVYVDLDDARAFARWAGKRLPTEEEWQYAAQGTDGRRYPWGDALEPGRFNGGQTGGTTPVTAFPAGRSPFGCLDQCGNVWEWTESERSDGRTRFAIVRGGSFYQAKGSGWYLDGGPRPVDFACKVLLMWAGLDRCATVGFRCAVDLKA